MARVTSETNEKLKAFLSEQENELGITNALNEGWEPDFDEAMEWFEQFVTLSPNQPPIMLEKLKEILTVEQKLELFKGFPARLYASIWRGAFRE